MLFKGKVLFCVHVITGICQGWRSCITFR